MVIGNWRLAIGDWRLAIGNQWKREEASCRSETGAWSVEGGAWCVLRGAGGVLRRAGGVFRVYLFTCLRIEGGFDGEAAALKDMSVDHGGFDILMAEEFLDGADVVASL